MDSLVQTGNVARGYLGASADTITADVAEQLGLAKDTRGVVITDIDPDSPAEKAGLKRSDVIVAINQHAVSTREELRLLVAQTVPETPTTLKIMRDGAPRTLSVTLGQVIENPDELLAGVDVTLLTPEIRRRIGLNDPRITGLVISKVAPDSPYQDRLAENMVILEINRGAVRDLKTARERVRPGRNLFAIFDGRSIRYVVITVR
jgi:serine protease Do/serine protease DegQ